MISSTRAIRSSAWSSNCLCTAPGLCDGQGLLGSPQIYVTTARLRSASSTLTSWGTPARCRYLARRPLTSSSRTGFPGRNRCGRAAAKSHPSRDPSGWPRQGPAQPTTPSQDPTGYFGDVLEYILLPPFTTAVTPLSPRHHDRLD